MEGGVDSKRWIGRRKPGGWETAYKLCPSISGLSSGITSSLNPSLTPDWFDSFIWIPTASHSQLYHRSDKKTTAHIERVLYTVFCSKLSTCVNSFKSLKQPYKVGYYYYPHYIDEEPEPQ